MVSKTQLEDKLVKLLREAACDLPKEVEKALQEALNQETDEIARNQLETILDNIEIARNNEKPLCQDTGTPIFYVKRPQKTSEGELMETIESAVRRATKEVPLRPNAVDPVTGVNSGDNTGVGVPVIHFEEWDKDKVRFDLMLKGGGSENCTYLYKLPNSRLNAERDLDGVSKCVLDAVVQTQGKACSPNIIGVGIGGLTDTVIELSKKQFLRSIEDTNEDKELASLEEKLLEKINQLDIGPMGLGGKTTALAVKTGKLHRNPPSFFIAVSFMCWACRNRSLEVEL